MASDKELIDKYQTIYNDILYETELFGYKYPDNKDGYNAFVNFAEKILRKAKAVGGDTFAPLPPKK
jgi:hypothetical protein